MQVVPFSKEGRLSYAATALNFGLSKSSVPEIPWKHSVVGDKEENKETILKGKND